MLRELRKNTAQQIVDGRGNDNLALKANHELTHTAVISYVEEVLNNNPSRKRHQQLDESSKKQIHVRNESRIYTQFEVPSDSPNYSQWTGLSTIELVVDRSAQVDKA